MLVEAYAALICESILYGIYIVLFSISMYLLLRRRHTIPVRVVHNTVMTMTVTMFLVSTTHMGLSVREFFNEFLDGHSPSSFEIGTTALRIAKLYLPAINFLLSDAIIIWRAYVLWNFEIGPCLVPVFLLLSTAVIAVVGVQQTAANIATVQLTASYPWYLSLDVLTLSTNVLTTCLVAYRARWYNRLSNESAQDTDERRQSQAVLRLLIESGFLYCLIWVIFFIIYWTRSSGNFMIADMIAQLTGIYSTLIIVLVALQMTHSDAVEDSDFDTSFGMPMRNVPSSLSTASVFNGFRQPVVIHVMNTVEDDSGIPHGK
ncbi:hypothetical protein HETIRDRAFT_453955 [Heterobasidion irregulare TC 32-1]|uniref:Uncharacterized protein n=1 Tax=Heterobasidion irregulare (strain TC 32-1) TaxID=747525 RepID=W4JWM5_HETIT|nr:uncharacterized protein HETIRDRAFT_453955 [Heterobasidion irregulare TC 32-1]ETW77849.1 hypothetical protein HETIRDRAFT_453955 [Heterobasidion irregulare TC 32-1]